MRDVYILGQVVPCGGLGDTRQTLEILILGWDDSLWGEGSRSNIGG